jgi:hypothetical protein
LVFGVDFLGLLGVLGLAALWVFFGALGLEPDFFAEDSLAVFLTCLDGVVPLAGGAVVVTAGASVVAAGVVGCVGAALGL